MILLTFKSGERFHLGVKTPAGIVDVETAVTSLELPTDVDVPDRVGSLLAGGQFARRALEHLVDRAVESGNTAPWLLDESELTLGPCVPHPRSSASVSTTVTTWTSLALLYQRPRSFSPNSATPSLLLESQSPYQTAQCGTTMRQNWPSSSARVPGT